jgi:hypothetical protein
MERGGIDAAAGYPMHNGLGGRYAGRDLFQKRQLEMKGADAAWLKTKAKFDS